MMDHAWQINNYKNINTHGNLMRLHGILKREDIKCDMGELMRVLPSVVAGLPSAQAKVFKLYYFQQMSIVEINKSKLIKASCKKLYQTLEFAEAKVVMKLERRYSE